MNLSILLSSTVVAGVIAAIVSLLINSQKNSIENVTQERAKWRDKIRSLSAAGYKAIKEDNLEEIMAIRASLTLLLNPIDREDNAILNSLVNCKNDDQKAEEFTKRISLLLKHDWERAKKETKFFSWCADDPKRIKYLTYIKSSNPEKKISEESPPSPNTTSAIN